MWNSYFYLKEALKTQRPELIVLEGYGISYDEDYSDLGVIIKNTYGMKWTKNRVKATKASISEEFLEQYLVDYPVFHNRYSMLNKGDFIGNVNFDDQEGYHHYRGLMGQYIFDTSTCITIADMSYVTSPIDLHPKVEEYYRKIIELANQEGIPILVVIAPYDLSEVEERKYIRAGQIAYDYNVGFINCNLLLDDIGMDLLNDYHDYAHMTVLGSDKYTKYIGAYMKDNYDISNHMHDVKYSAWMR